MTKELLERPLLLVATDTRMVAAYFRAELNFETFPYRASRLAIGRVPLIRAHCSHKRLCPDLTPCPDLPCSAGISPRVLYAQLKGRLSKWSSWGGFFLEL